MVERGTQGMKYFIVGIGMFTIHALTELGYISLQVALLSAFTIGMIGGNLD